ncbi:hypothetical protein GN956_G1378 [Arapaima gigas]
MCSIVLAQKINQVKWKVDVRLVGLTIIHFEVGFANSVQVTVGSCPHVQRKSERAYLLQFNYSSVAQMVTQSQRYTFFSLTHSCNVPLTYPPGRGHPERIKKQISHKEAISLPPLWFLIKASQEPCWVLLILTDLLLKCCYPAGTCQGHVIPPRECCACHVVTRCLVDEIVSGIREVPYHLLCSSFCEASVV